MYFSIFTLPGLDQNGVFAYFSMDIGRFYFDYPGDFYSFEEIGQLLGGN